MDYIMNSAGAASPCIREYEIETEEDLFKGTVVTLENGKVRKADDEDTILGILAESYKVAKEELNPRSGSKRVRVIVSPGMILALADKTFEVAEAGGENEIIVSGLDIPQEADAFKGGYVKLVYKNETSTNKDHVGLAREILASAGNKLTVKEGGAASVGDIYALVPPCGFDAFALSGNGSVYEFSNNRGGKIKVVSALPERDHFEICFKETFIH
jgi:hypothetical protein